MPSIQLIRPKRHGDGWICWDSADFDSPFAYDGNPLTPLA
jgi:hypothetical protein